MSTNLEGKTCLVTGATSGIGKATAAGLVRMGASVVLVGRSKEKCESVMQEINDGKVSYLVADLSSQTSIRQLANQYKASHHRLDVLVNNAGIFAGKRIVTVDGIEATIAVNHLAAFLLTDLLLDLLKTSAPSRIVTTSSVAHRGAQIDFDDLQFEKRRYNGIKSYSQSKLANILFTKELATKLEASGVTSNCFHPGAVRTGLARGGNPWYYQLIWTIAGSFFLSPERGADTAIYLASSPEVEGVTGKYFAKRKEVRPSAQAESFEAAARLWEVSEKLVGQVRNRASG